MTDLSVLIPARNEEFLYLTVNNLLKNIRGNTEILVGLDGAWANPPIKNDPRVTILFHNESRGQRAMTNDLCRLSKAKYVMKLDAHCAVDEGFDVKMVEAMRGHDDWTMIPTLYNLHAFDWKCLKCGNVWYQSATPKHCQNPGEKRGNNPNCDNTTDFERIMVWQRRESRKSDFYRFDTTLHFQYHGIRKLHPEAKGDIVETMSAQGSCWMLTREKYWELNICDEEFGSWGQQGTEVACKTWLSGGRLITNRRTWYAHLFRTQQGFGFPFPISNSQVDHARKYSRELFLENTWKGQVRPLSWLLEKFRPLPDWHDPKNKDILDKAIKSGEKFGDKSVDKKGIIYYTDNKLNLKLARAVQKQLKSIGLPIVSASLKPMDFGTNIHVPLERGILTMFIQILTALENSTADVVFFCEHDVLYHPSHFEFTPPEKEKFYYNENFWKMDQRSGKAISYESKQVSGICVYRETAIKHYKKRIELVQKNGFSMRMGYEPGTHNRAERVDDLTSEGWKSKFPNVDVRHDGNLSPTRWSKEEFRNQKYTKGWIEGNYATISGWDANFLKSVLL